MHVWVCGLNSFDSHCHLQDARFDLDGVEARRRAAGVGVLVPAVRGGEWQGLREGRSRRGWRIALGTHPWAVHEGWALPDPRGADAVGEVGLDRRAPAPMDVQIAALREHLDLALSVGLPVVLHCVRAHDLLPPILREFPAVRGVLHSYSGGAELVRAYTHLGMWFSFGGAITWRGARKPLAALRAVPKERLLFESDGPDQRPTITEWPWGSEPAVVPAIIASAEAIRGEALSEQVLLNGAELGWG